MNQNSLPGLVMIGSQGLTFISLFMVSVFTTAHKVWLYFYRFWWISYKWMSCLSAGTFRMSTRVKRKSRPEFGCCLSVEDTWPPTMRDHILLMENPEKERNLILGISQGCYGQFKFLDLNCNFKDNSCLIIKMGPNISLQLQTEFHYN